MVCVCVCVCAIIFASLTRFIPPLLVAVRFNGLTPKRGRTKMESLPSLETIPCASLSRCVWQCMAAFYLKCVGSGKKICRRLAFLPHATFFDTLISSCTSTRALSNGHEATPVPCVLSGHQFRLCTYWARTENGRCSTKSTSSSCPRPSCLFSSSYGLMTWLLWRKDDQAVLRSGRGLIDDAGALGHSECAPLVQQCRRLVRWPIASFGSSCMCLHG